MSFNSIKLRSLSLSVRLIAIVIVLFNFFSCNKENAPDCIQSAGEFTTIKRSLEEFDVIELRDYLQIELYDTTAYYVEITAPKNLVPDISTEVQDGRLKIVNHNTCNFVRSFKKRITIRIYAPHFEDIQNFGTGDIKSVNTISTSHFKIENRNAAGKIELDLNCDTVTLATHTGVCDIYAKGQSDVTNVFNQGLGIIDAQHLLSNNAFVNNSSINSVYVNTNGYFFALIEFSGNIYYSGIPNHIDRSIRGNGQLIKID